MFTVCSFPRPPWSAADPVWESAGMPGPKEETRALPVSSPSPPHLCNQQSQHTTAFKSQCRLASFYFIFNMNFSYNTQTN